MVFNRHRDFAFSFYPAGADDLYLCAGLQQRAGSGAAKPRRCRHAARHLADGADCAHLGAGQPGVRHAARLAGDAL